MSQCVGVVRAMKYVRDGRSNVHSARAQHARLVRTSSVARERPTGTPSHHVRGQQNSWPRRGMFSRDDFDHFWMPALR